MTLENLFKKRRTNYIKELLKYVRIVVNDHFVLILFILLGAGGFAYSNYLETLSLGMLSPRILVAILFFIVTSTGGLTLLLEPADKIYLLPKEREFQDVFKKLTYRSYLESLISVAMVTVVTFPIFVATFNAETIDGLFIFLALSGLKWLNYLVKIAPFFENNSARNQKKQLVFAGVKLITIVSLAFINIKITAVLITGLVLYTVYLFATNKIYSDQVFKWETMIQAEEKRRQRLFRFIGMFTDVPKIETSIKRLPWLDGVLDSLSKRTQNAPYYYVLRLATRNTDYSMLVIRAAIVGSILLLLTANVTISVVLLLLFLYIIGFQLITLVDQVKHTPQFQIYPIMPTAIERAVFKFIFQILNGVNIILTISAMISLGLIGLTLLPIGILMSYLFSYVYTPRRLKR